ncbi:MAG: FAD:protein FMN transferase [Pleurocapsa minor GSE-CHR-MK-17-07R]|jgi:thiamine biosynthesis lipoprotein|nr:FAD:protein FMN transferase [Pleurocapsa minor GSE-CHR-MK 17-07R]
MKRVIYTSFRAMGCGITIQLETDADASQGLALLAELPAQVEVLEASLSRFRPDSELMRFNDRAGQWCAVSAVLFENIHAAKHAARLTNGAFNPLVLPALLANGYARSFGEIGQPDASAPVPAADWQAIELRPESCEVRIPAGSAIDLGGSAKGWAASHLADGLSPYGACLVNIGGDMVARGAPEGQPGWEAQIADPHTGDPLVSLWLRDTSLVTSGTDFRRWTTADGTQRHHIIDPRTGLPARSDVLSVSISHPDATTAEAYAKAVLLRGAEAGLTWLQAQWNSGGLVVRHDGAVLTTPDFAHLYYERNLP